MKGLLHYICDRILENSSKSHMKYAVFHHVFKVISVNVYVILAYFFNELGNLCYEFHTVP